MLLRSLFFIALSLPFALASELAPLKLSESKIILEAPEGWSIRDRNGEIGIYSPDQRSKGLPSRVHLSRYIGAETTLQAAIDAEIDRITARAPKWGSGNDRTHYKGSTPIQTESGMHGLRANFYSDFYEDHPHGRQYTIVKYYFFDEHGKIFRVCSHVYGDEARFNLHDQSIRAGLKFTEK